MTSCEEATFFLRNCSGTKMDGNNDGVPYVDLLVARHWQESWKLADFFTKTSFFLLCRIIKKLYRPLLIKK